MRRSSPIAYVLLYVALYGAFGVASPFWPKLFESKGVEPQQIGLILAAGLVVRLAAGPLVGRLADFAASLRLVLAICCVMAAASGAALATANAFWPVLLVASVQAAALAPTSASAHGWGHGGWGHGFGHGPHFGFYAGYAGYGGCIRERWVPTPYGLVLRSVNVCY